MGAMVRIAVVGDRDPANATHAATDAALGHAADALGTPVRVEWTGTEVVDREGAPTALAGVAGVLVSPGSPYRSIEGALAAIAHARTTGLPLLGTCGGLQHVVLEVARHLAGFEDAAHAEYDPYASNLFVTPLSCSLAGTSMTVHLADGSLAARASRGHRALLLQLRDQPRASCRPHPGRARGQREGPGRRAAGGGAPGAPVLRGQPVRAPSVEQPGRAPPPGGDVRARRAGDPQASSSASSFVTVAQLRAVPTS